MNLADRLRDTAARLPDKTALIAQQRSVIYGDLDAVVDGVAAGFQRLGLRPGDRVALLLGNTPTFVEALFGALRAGLIVVPLNPALAAPEVSHALADSGARAVVAGESSVGLLGGLRPTLPGLDHVVVAGTSASAPDGETWNQVAGRGAQPQPVETGEDALAMLQYTSGTTGRSKGAMLTHANLAANQDQMSRTRLRLEEDDIVLAVLPLFHIYALNVGLAFTLTRGATVVLAERFDPVETLEEVVRHRVSILLGAPPVYVAWLNVPDAGARDLGSVRLALSGAAPLPPTVLRRFGDELGIPIWEGYGLTETSPVLTTTAMGDQPRPGSVGKPLPGVELRLVDDHGRPVRRGDPGEVVVRGPNVFPGYWRDDAATAAVFDDDSWFHTGDVGYAEEGNLYLVDRKSDLIIVSGFNVYPGEVEDVLTRHPKVAEAAVVPSPHPYTGECVKAFVVLRDGEDASVDELIGFCQRSLARFKCPDVVEFAETLPHLPTGKVRRRDLRQAGATGS